MSKSPQAFRTIREVADWLDVAAHVLRFWESKFPQIKPVKRAGGRRYYRPGDMELVGGIKVLLHDQGMTIKGVQNMLASEGIARVSQLAPPLDEDATPSEASEVDLWEAELNALEASDAAEERRESRDAAQPELFDLAPEPLPIEQEPVEAPDPEAAVEAEIVPDALADPAPEPEDEAESVEAQAEITASPEPDSAPLPEPEVVPEAPEIAEPAPVAEPQPAVEPAAVEHSADPIPADPPSIDPAPHEPPKPAAPPPAMGVLMAELAARQKAAPESLVPVQARLAALQSRLANART